MAVTRWGHLQTLLEYKHHVNTVHTQKPLQGFEAEMQDKPGGDWLSEHVTVVTDGNICNLHDTNSHAERNL